MSIYAHIKRCLELADRDIASALGDRRMAKALLDQLAKVSRPGDGAPKLLLVFARLAGAEVDWIDGALRVEMVGDADGTLVEVLSELGLGMHERVFPSFKMSVPLEEFARAVERVPHMVAPLAIASATGRRLVLTATSDEEEEEGTPSAAVSIGDDSLYMKRGSKEKLAEAAAKALNPAESEPPPPAPVMATPRVVRKSIRPAALPPPVDEPMKAAPPARAPEAPRVAARRAGVGARYRGGARAGPGSLGRREGAADADSGSAFGGRGREARVEAPEARFDEAAAQASVEAPRATL